MGERQWPILRGTIPEAALTGAPFQGKSQTGHAAWDDGIIFNSRVSKGRPRCKTPVDAAFCNLGFNVRAIQVIVTARAQPGSNSEKQVLALKNGLKSQARGEKIAETTLKTAICTMNLKLNGKSRINQIGNPEIPEREESGK